MIYNQIKNEILKKNLVCSKPFENIEIDEKGNVFSCCPDYLKGYYLGNIFDSSFEEIWFGENFNKLRQDVLDGLYTNCCLDFCYNIENSVFKNKNKYLNKKIRYPKYVTISIDKTCNARCVFCRDKVFVPDKERENKLIGMIDSFFIPLLKNAKSMLIEGSGELFVSKFDKILIQKAAKKYPKLRFELLTNGFLCNEKNLKKLGIYDRLSLVTVSMHAVTKNTYEKIVKGKF